MVKRGGADPDLYIIFDIPYQIGLQRKGLRERLFFEKLGEDFHKKVAEGYCEFVKRAQRGDFALAKRVEVIDARPMADVTQDLICLIESVRRSKVVS